VAVLLVVAVLLLLRIPVVAFYHGRDWSRALHARLPASVVLITFFPPEYTSHFKPRTPGDWPTVREGVALYLDSWHCYVSLHNYALVTERIEFDGFPTSDVGLRGPALDIALSALPFNASAQRAALRQGQPWHPNWIKAPLLRRHLPLHSWVVWFDADSVIVSLPTRVETALGDACDGGEVAAFGADGCADVVAFGRKPNAHVGVLIAETAAAVFAVRNSAGGAWFLQRWWELRARCAQWHDQGAFMNALLEMVLRQRAAALDGDASGWLGAAYDSVESPCLDAHWSIGVDDTVRLEACLARALPAGAGVEVHDRKTGRLRAVRAGPLAFSFILAANLANVGSARWDTHKARARLAQAGEPPVFMHTKLGMHNPFADVYREGAIGELARACHPNLRCVDAATFAQHAFAATFSTPNGPEDDSWLTGACG
jgi:hypothetical protein